MRQLLPSVDSALQRVRAVGWEALGRALLGALLVGFFPVAMYRALGRTGGTDFPEFYAAGRAVLEHRQIDSAEFLKYYWPSLNVAWAGLAWMPYPAAAAVWYAIGCWSWVGLLLAVHRLLVPYVSAPTDRHAILAAGLLVLPLALDHLCLGAFHIMMLWWMVSGLGRVSRGRDWSGGMLLGLAIWVKLLPLLGVGYLMLKRKWLAAAIAIASALAIDLALTLPVFGPEKTWQLHRKWWAEQAQGALQRTLGERRALDEDRPTNQSLAVVLRRLLTRMGWEAFPARRQVSLADLSGAGLRVVYFSVAGVLGLGIVGYCRRPADRLGTPQWATQIALVSLATLWFSPVAWSYHPTAAAPALAVILAQSPRRPRLARGVAAWWLASLALLGWPLARSAGAMLWTTLGLGAILVGITPRGGGRTEPGPPAQAAADRRGKKAPTSSATADTTSGAARPPQSRAAGSHAAPNDSSAPPRDRGPASRSGPSGSICPRPRSI